jgi:phospholipid/cholesterol/gamma-HCH transport system ATP-binding protein
MYDEPFAGLDPISMGTTARLIRQLNDALGITSIVVSHDVAETFAIADRVVILADGGVAARARRTSCAPAGTRWCASSSAPAGGAGAVPLPGPTVEQDFGQEAAR